MLRPSSCSRPARRVTKTSGRRPRSAPSWSRPRTDSGTPSRTTPVDRSPCADQQLQGPGLLHHQLGWDLGPERDHPQRGLVLAQLLLLRYRLRVRRRSPPRARSTAPPSLGPTAASPWWPAPRTALAITTQPSSSVTAGTAFTVGVSVEDQYGNVITTGTGNNDAISVTLSSGSFASGSTTTATARRAWPASRTSRSMSGSYTVTVSDTTHTAVTSATTSSFTVAPPPRTLVYHVQPAGPQTAEATVVPRLHTQDQFGNPVTTGLGPTTLHLSLSSAHLRQLGRDLGPRPPTGPPSPSFNYHQARARSRSPPRARPTAPPSRRPTAASPVAGAAERLGHHHPALVIGDGGDRSPWA